jgi:hypothetical protein
MIGFEATHSQMIRPPSLDALRSSSSDESACAGEFVSTSRSTELSTAVSIARAFQIAVHGQTLGQAGLAAPFFENVVRNLLPPHKRSIYGVEFEHGAGEEPKFFAHCFGNRDLTFFRKDCVHTLIGRNSYLYVNARRWAGLRIVTNLMTSSSCEFVEFVSEIFLIR